MTTSDKIRRRSHALYARGRRHDGECYGAVLDPRKESGAIAYHRVRGQRESLILRRGPHAEEIVVSENAYILSPHFVGDFLVWSENREGRHWEVKAFCRETGRSFSPFLAPGRPRAFYSAPGPDGFVLVWEERQGRRTRVRLSVLSGSTFGEPRDMTDGSNNAYDPVCATSEDGIVHVAWASFLDGNYRIVMQRLTREAGPASAPGIISLHTSACAYPSLEPCRGGGVWFSYTVFGIPFSSDETRYVQHLRRQAQHALFQGPGELRIGLYKNGELSAVCAPHQPWAKYGPAAAMIVYGSRGAGRSRLLVDETGRVHALFRRHADRSPVHYEEQQDALSRDTDEGITAGPNNHPDLCLMTLLDDAWSPVETLVSRASFDEMPSAALDGRKLRFAFTEDARRTGWGRQGEWFDRQGEVGVGQGVAILPEMPVPRYQFHPFRLPMRPGPSLEEPCLADASEKGFLCALGHTHAHSNLSICGRESDRDPHFNYRFMQDVQHSDFGMLTDHCYNMWQTEALLMRKLADYYYFPGKFVALQAYEWTGSGDDCCHHGGPFGHLNVLSFEENAGLEIFTPLDPGSAGCSAQKLAACYAGGRILCIPHHTADGIHSYNWTFFDEEIMPVVEIFQDIRGSGEHPQAAGVANSLHADTGWMCEELVRGRRFGLLASADHFGVARAGAWIRELTRTGLYEAFMARRVFGTSGLSAGIRFTCNGVWMGRETSGKKVRFTLTAEAAERIAHFEIVRDGEDVERRTAAKNRFSFSWRASPRRSGEFWYCRLLFENGELAWTSPIWLV